MANWKLETEETVSILEMILEDLCDECKRDCKGCRRSLAIMTAITALEEKEEL